jgi:hypothetical protein
MIAHVASTGEDRGRVVLQLRSAVPNVVAVETAIRIARAFQSEIESLFVEDEQLLDCAGYSFVREISLSGRQRSISAAGMIEDLRLAALGARRQIEALARAAEVPLRSRVVRDEPLRALSIACAESGPWNVVVLADPLVAGNSTMLRQLMVEIGGTTGLGLVGPKAQRVAGPAIMAVEDTNRLAPMLHAAERLAALDGTSIVLLLLATDQEHLDRMEGEARLVMEAREDVRIQAAEVTHGDPGAIAENLRRLHGGFLICQFGGLVVPEQGDLRPLLSVLQCPLLLVR